MFRKAPREGHEAEQAWREVLDRLEKLEAGGAIAGNISLAAQHRLLDVQVDVVDTGNGHRTITYTSPAGVSATIASL